MTKTMDWNKLKVVELKEECKSRNIPLTGLKLKQQLIDKLTEFETDRVVEEENTQESPEALQREIEEPPEVTIGEQDHPEIKGEEVNGDVSTPEVPANKHEAAQTEGKTEEIEEAGVDKQPSTEERPTDMAKHISEEPQEQKLETIQPTLDADTTLKSPAENNLKPELKAPTNEHENTPVSVVSANSNASSQNPTDLSDDQRKRKRRSLTPIPSSAEVAMKKAKANDGTPVIIGTNVVESIEAWEGTNAKSGNEYSNQVNRDGTMRAQSTDKPSTSEVVASDVLQQKPYHETVEANGPNSIIEQANSEERDVSPARHPATSSLYMKNFKRPLHIPTLRNYIETLASKPSDATSPIKSFYLDSIRTHGFVSFISISAASRVRNAMHGKKFPDEPIREPIFVDFIPDDQVQKWIDIENSSQGLGRSGKKFEVVYHDGTDGVEAILQDSDSKQPTIPNRMSIDQPKQSLSGIHPDRLGLVPKDDLVDRSRSKHNSSGVGFKALDELFSSTTTKPKLYFKCVPVELTNERLEMVRNLKLGYSDMGKSGDEGMKRFSFENIRGKEEWVDKGPEFGFGRKGQDRLTGFRGRGGGGPFHRGGFGSRGDTWRGRN